MVKAKSKDRVQQIIYSVLAIILLFGGVPLTAFFIFDLDRNLDGGNVWESMEEDDLEEVSIAYEGGDKYTVPLIEMVWNGFFQNISDATTEHKGMILWNYNNDTLEQIIMAPSIEKGSYDGIIHLLAIFTNWTLDSMVHNDINICRFQISSSVPITVGLVFHEINDGMVDVAKNVTTLVDDQTLRTGNHTIFFNWTALDLLEIKSERGGSAILSIQIGADADRGFITGDQIGFDVGFNPIDDDGLTQYTILKIGAGVIAVVYGITALACTGLWNPLSKNDPGVVDRGLSWISKRFSKKKKRGKK